MESHISRKTSEMWGTRRLVAGMESKARSSTLACYRQAACSRRGRDWWGIESEREFSRVSEIYSRMRKNRLFTQPIASAA
jgi:hypothetical protein